MEPESYLSCIKINGVPILPPLMTDDIRSEMNYYKQLAIAVEEKLKNLQIAKQNETDKCLDNKCNTYNDETLKTDSCVSTVDDSCNTDTDSVTIDSTPNTATAVEWPTKENEINISACKLESIDTSISESVTSTAIPACISMLDEENNDHHEELLINSMSSDTVTASTDLNHYLDISATTRPTTADTSPEFIKPQVPTTLDIVPITVDGPRPENINSSDSVQLCTDTPSKLVRQGSYVLEAPSPLLLAHMQTELANSNYVPTLTTNATKRKEWNITQAKTEWEKQIRNKELIIPDASKTVVNHSRVRRNSISTVSNQKVCQTVPRTKPGAHLKFHQAARSVDCIQTMLATELVRKSNNKVNNYSQRYNCNVNSYVRSTNSTRCKTNRSVSILNLANQLGGSLGNLTNIGTQSRMLFEKKQSNNTETTANLDSNSPKNVERQNLSSPLKSVITSNKLLTILKEVQRTHDEQMAELMARQHNEQKNMREEFEKQQILLFSQIKKTFPEISTSQLDATLSATIPRDSKQREQICNRSSDSQNDDETQCPNILSTTVECPLNYIYPLNGHCQSVSHQTNHSHSTQTSEDESLSKSDDFVSIINTSAQRSENESCLNDSEHTVSSIRRHSNVSRELFPLDSKTMHVPVPDTTGYTDKHIHAANIINAYARGYFVRRMMKTERVIALKNTYREALHCMLKLHVDAPLNLPELNFHQRLQLQCDAASMNIVELFAQSVGERMQVIAQDREIKRSRAERPNSARSYSFATQRTLARKKLKEMGGYQTPPVSKSWTARTRCQTWTSNSKERRPQNISFTGQGIKRSTSAGTVRRPWR